MLADVDIRTTPLLTSRETALHLQIPVSTLNHWLSEGRGRSALVHRVEPVRTGWPRLPFVGVVEAYVLRSLRDLGLTKAAIREAAAEIRAEFGSEYALASRRIASDGVDLFIRYADGVASARAGQRPIHDVLNRHLRFVTWDYDGWPRRLRLEQYLDTAPVVIDPRFAWGDPVLEHSKTPVSSVVELWRAGEPTELVASEFGLTRENVEQICRVPPAA